jgi:hypothetical protein
VTTGLDGSSPSRDSPSAFADPIGGLPAGEWDQLADSMFYSSRPWLEICSQDKAVTAGAVYGRAADGTLAAVPVAEVHGELNPFYRWTQQLTDRGLPAPAQDGLLIGASRGNQTRILATEGADPVQTARIVLEALNGMARDSRAPRVAMFLSTADVIALRKAGVPVMPVLLNVEGWFAIPEGGYESWLDSIGGRHRAGTIRREQRLFAQAGYEITEASLSEWIPEVARLLTNTESRYGHTSDPAIRENFLRRMARTFGPAARVVLCSPPGEAPIGYCLFYRWGDTVYLRSTGFDYPRLRQSAEYFNVTYYLPIQIAAREGARWVHAGIEATEAKALRGAQLRPLWLLDLSIGSVLIGCDTEILAANARFSERLRSQSPVVAAAWPQAEDELVAGFAAA